MVSLFAFALSAQAADLTVVPARQRDVPEILQLDRSVGGSLTRDQFMAQARRGSTVPSVIYFDHRVVGYIIRDLHRDRQQITRVALSPDAPEEVAAALVAELQRKFATGTQNYILVHLRPEQKTEAAAFEKAGMKLISQDGKSTNLLLSHPDGLKPDLATWENKTLYERLELSEQAGASEVEKAFAAMRVIYKEHPEILKLLQHSRDVLVDPRRRALYDEKEPRVAKPETEPPTRVSNGENTAALGKARPGSKLLYRRLGVAENASQEVLFQAYNRLVRDLNDRNPQDSARSLKAHRNLDEAISILGRVSSREAYDRLVQTNGEATRADLDKILEDLPEGLPTRADRLGFNPLAVSAYQMVGLRDGAIDEEIQMKAEELWKRYPGLSWEHPEVSNALGILLDTKLKKVYDKEYRLLSPQGRRELLWSLPYREEATAIAGEVADAAHAEQPGRDLLTKLASQASQMPVEDFILQAHTNTYGLAKPETAALFLRALADSLSRPDYPGVGPREFEHAMEILRVLR
ncbi:hypothetical protein K2X33_09825, partial [bacterium]|nr:hypothetical protein [bacterium]